MKNFVFFLTGLALAVISLPITSRAQPQQAIYYQEAQQLEAQAARAEAARGVQSAAMQQAANANGAAASALKSAVPVLSAAPQVLGLLHNVFGSGSAGSAGGGAAAGQVGSQAGEGQASEPTPVSKPVFNSLSDMMNSPGGTVSPDPQNSANPTGNNASPTGANNSGDSLSGILDSGGNPAPPSASLNPDGAPNTGGETASAPQTGGENSSDGLNNLNNSLNNNLNTPSPAPNAGDTLDSALTPPNTVSQPIASPSPSPTSPVNDSETTDSSSTDQNPSLYDQAKNSFNNFLTNTKQSASDALNNLIPEQMKSAGPFLDHVGHGVGINVGGVQQKDYGDGLDAFSKSTAVGSTP